MRCLIEASVVKVVLSLVIVLHEIQCIVTRMYATCNDDIHIAEDRLSSVEMLSCSFSLRRHYVITNNYPYSYQVN